MQTKVFEVRDRHTFIPVLATRFRGADHRLLHAAGFAPGEYYVVVVSLATGQSAYDPYSWDVGGRSLRESHLHIIKNWETLKDGDVVDVEFILGETKKPKKSDVERQL